jgi:hypothetical protein
MTKNAITGSIRKPAHVQHEFREAAAETASCTPFRVPKSKKIMITDSYFKSGPPKSKILWYYSGRQGATGTISLQRLPNSGGHFHPGGPVGIAEPSQFRLNGPWPQNVVVTTTMPDAAGMIFQIVQFSTGEVLRDTNFCGLFGLLRLASSTDIVLTGSSTEHPDNHYGTTPLLNAIKQLASIFRKQFKKPIYVNDMSLPNGGLYDFKKNWRPPHRTHREGRTVDINSSTMSTQERAFFSLTAKKLGFSVKLEHGPGIKEHWHLYI